MKTLIIIKTESRDITTNLTEIKNIMRLYHEQFFWHANYGMQKFCSLHEMDRLPETHKLLQLTQEEIENLKKYF